MDNDIERLVAVTGTSLPLAGRIVAMIVDSGASQLEVLTALDLVRTVLCLLPIPAVVEQ